MRRSVVLLAGVVGFLGSSLVAFADPTAPAPSTTAPVTTTTTTTTTTTAPATTVATMAPAARPVADTAHDLDPNEMICKTMAPTTGTRLGARRECQTRHQWDMQQQEAARELEKMQGTLPGVPGNN